MNITTVKLKRTERVFARVKLKDKASGRNNKGCWLIPNESRQGYPYVWVKIGNSGVRCRANRAAYRLFRRSFNKELDVLHSCDEPACINPEHLFLGTAKDNVLDMLRKGRQRGRLSGMTHCARGHEFSDENTYWYRFMRSCKICKRERLRQWRKKK